VPTSLATRKMIYRLLDQYRENPEIVGFLEAVGARFDDSDAIIEALLFGQYLDTATGPLLDRLGVILGFPRPAAEQIEGVFTYRSLSNPIHLADRAYGSTAIPGLGGAYQSLRGLYLDEMASDDEYRALLRVRAKSIGAGAAIPDLYEWLVAVTGVGITLSEPAAAAVSVTIDAPIPYQIRRTIENNSPALAGVSLTVDNWEVP
jgi:hypothetical protein